MNLLPHSMQVSEGHYFSDYIFYFLELLICWSLMFWNFILLWYKFSIHRYYLIWGARRLLSSLDKLILSSFSSRNCFYFKKNSFFPYFCLFPHKNPASRRRPSRWQRSKMWKSPSSPQIYQKYIYMWKKSYRTPTECWQKTPDFPKCKKIPTSWVGQKKKEKTETKE